MNSLGKEKGRALAGGEYSEAKYIILFVAIFLLAVLIGAFCAKMFYTSYDSELNVKVGGLELTDKSFQGIIFSIVLAEISTVIQLLLIAFSPLTKIPTLINSAIFLYRGLSLGWCCVYLTFSTDFAVTAGLIGYAVASVLIIFFAAEGSVFTRDKEVDLSVLGHYFSGFLMMSAGVFIAELVPLLIFSK